MEPTVDDEQYERMLGASMSDQYYYFHQEVAAWETLWALELDDGWATVFDADGRRGFPVWPHRRYAEECVTGEWARARPAGIEVYSWLELLDELEARGENVAIMQRPDGRHVPAEPAQIRSDVLRSLDEFAPLEDEEG